MHPPSSILQGCEAWEGYGGWISGGGVTLGPGVRERFEAASKITREQRDKAAANRDRRARAPGCKLISMHAIGDAAARGAWPTAAARLGDVPQAGGPVGSLAALQGVKSSDPPPAPPSHPARRIRAHLVQLLAGGAVLALPSAPGPAPLIGLPGPQLDDWRARVMSLTCIAGLGALPQVSLPIARVGGLPVGLSLIGPPGSDESLLELAERIATA